MAKVRAQTRVLRYPVKVIRDRVSGGFVGLVPDLPGCVTQGETEREVLDNLEEAIRGYIFSLRKHGDPVPAPSANHIVEVVA